jgi:WD40 repeat protein
MVNDEARSTSPEALPNADLAGLAEPSSAKSRIKRFFVVLGNGILWAVVLGGLAFFYGLYDVATGATGIASLLVLAATSIGLIALFWHYQRAAAVVNYEFGVFAVWIGYFSGSVSLSNWVDGHWFFMFFFAWIFSALLGGAIVASWHERRGHSATARASRAFALVALLVAAGLLACGFTSLLLFENRPITAFCPLRTHFLEDVALSPNGQTLATIGGYIGEQRVAKLWDAATGSRKAIFIEEQDKSEPKCAAVQFTGDPPALAVASSSFEFGSTGKLTIRIWDMTTGQVQQCFQWDDDLYLRKPIFSSDGGSFVYVDGDGHVRVFDLRAGRLTADLARDEHHVRYLAVTPACDVLACVTDDQVLEIWDVANEQQKRVVTVDEEISSMGFSPDGRLIAYGTEGGCVDVIDVDGVRESTTISCFEDGSVDAVAFSPDGTMLVCGGGRRGLTRVVDTNRWKIVATLRNWDGRRTECLAFSPDGKRLATGGALNRVAIWDVMSLRLEP